MPQKKPATNPFSAITTFFKSSPKKPDTNVTTVTTVTSTEERISGCGKGTLFVTKISLTEKRSFSAAESDQLIRDSIGDFWGDKDFNVLTQDIFGDRGSFLLGQEASTFPGAIEVD